jgi:hypothetical protein
MLNQTPKKRKEVVMEIGVIEIEGTLFKEDKSKLKVIGDKMEFEVKGNELVINTYLL